MPNTIGFEHAAFVQKDYFPEVPFSQLTALSPLLCTEIVDFLAYFPMI